MVYKIDSMIESIESEKNAENFLEVCEQEIDKLSKSDGVEAIEALLRLIENNPNVDFGNPGPLVHFLEKSFRNGYEEKLLASFFRRPTSHNLWMVNRVINGVSEEERDVYSSALKTVYARKGLPEYMKDEINEVIMDLGLA